MFYDSTVLFDKAETLNIPDSIHIAYSGNKFVDEVSKAFDNKFEVVYTTGPESLETYLFDQSLLSLPDVLIMELTNGDETFKTIENIRRAPLLKHLLIILLTDTLTPALRNKVLALKVNDVYQTPLPVEDICNRVSFLVRFELLKPELEKLSNDVDLSYKINFAKRSLDVFLSLLAIIALSPLFLIIAVLIKLESKGPAFYISKRVGTGYKIFDFYKFRSMRTDAEVQLKSLAGMNQYTDAAPGTTSTFNKFVNDPRVTRIGKFLRNTSLDELPQLFNVLKGDMSLVGNRPLPLYEAELLTSNEWAMRFLGPAGLTGLWQVSRRGNESMSERERKKLDNYYAKNYSFSLDLKIIIKTLPAMIQKERV